MKRPRRRLQRQQTETQIHSAFSSLPDVRRDYQHRRRISLNDLKSSSTTYFITLRISKCLSLHLRFPTKCSQKNLLFSSLSESFSFLCAMGRRGQFSRKSQDMLSFCRHLRWLKIWIVMCPNGMKDLMELKGRQADREWKSLDKLLAQRAQSDQDAGRLTQIARRCHYAKFNFNTFGTFWYWSFNGALWIAH